MLQILLFLYILMAMGTEAMFEYGSDSVFPKVLEIKGLLWLLHISDWNIQKTCPLIKYL